MRASWCNNATTGKTLKMELSIKNAIKTLSILQEYKSEIETQTRNAINQKKIEQVAEQIAYFDNAISNWANDVDAILNEYNKSKGK